MPWPLIEAIAGRPLVVVMNVLRPDDRFVVRHDLQKHLALPRDRAHVALFVLERLLRWIHRRPGAFAVLVDEREFENLEAGTRRTEPGQECIHVQQIADNDKLALAGVHARHDLGMQPAVGLVPVFLRPDPFAVLRVVHDDELRPVLEMPEAADLLAARSRKDAHAVREDNVLLLPFLALALEREILNDIALDLAVVLLDELVRFEFVLDGGDIERCLAAGIGDKDDERIFIGVLKRGPQGKCETAERAFAGAAEANDQDAALCFVFKGVDKLGMEERGRVGEIAGKINQRKAEQRFAALLAGVERLEEFVDLLMDL